MLNPLPLGAQEAPTAVAASLAAFCEREPLASSEFERRARRSIVDQCRGVQRLAAAVGALLPRRLSRCTTDDRRRGAGGVGSPNRNITSSEEEESDFEDVELARGSSIVETCRVYL